MVTTSPHECSVLASTSPIGLVVSVCQNDINIAAGFLVRTGNDRNVLKNLQQV